MQCQCLFYFGDGRFLCSVCAVLWCFSVQICWCCVQKLRRLQGIWGLFAFCHNVAPCLSCVSSDFQPMPALQKLSCSLRNELYLTSRYFVFCFFFVLSLSSQKPLHFFHPSFSLPPSFLLPSTSPLFLPFLNHSLLFAFVLLCCPTRPLVTPPHWLCSPGPCDDCVLYQSVTCVLAQPLPARCTRRVVPCAAAAATGRRAA